MKGHNQSEVFIGLQAGDSLESWDYLIRVLPHELR